MKKLAYAFALGGSLVCGLAFAWTRVEAQRATVRVEPGVIRNRLVVQAVVVSQDGIAEVRPRTDGTVLRVLVSEGSIVRAGELLAELDGEELQANVRRTNAEARSLAAAARAVASGARDEERLAMEAEVTAARAQLAQAKDRARRSARLHEDGAEPEALTEDAARTEEIARAQLERAEARLRQATAGGTDNDIQAARERAAAAIAASQAARSVYDRVRMVSPINGVVLARRVDPGDTVTPTRGDMTAAFEIANADRTELRIEAEELDGNLLELGQAIRVQLPGGQSTVGHGRIVRIGARIQARTIAADEARIRGESKVRVAWAEWRADSTYRLALGQRAEAVIELPDRQVAARLPRNTIAISDGKAWVRLSKAIGRSEQVISLGQGDDRFVEVFGISPGTMVLASR